MVLSNMLLQRSRNVPFKLSPNVFDVGMLEMLHWKQLQCWLHIEV